MIIDIRNKKRILVDYLILLLNSDVFDFSMIFFDD